MPWREDHGGETCPRGARGWGDSAQAAMETEPAGATPRCCVDLPPLGKQGVMERKSRVQTHIKSEEGFCRRCFHPNCSLKYMLILDPIKKVFNYGYHWDAKFNRYLIYFLHYIAKSMWTPLYEDLQCLILNREISSYDMNVNNVENNLKLSLFLNFSSFHNNGRLFLFISRSFYFQKKPLCALKLVVWLTVCLSSLNLLSTFNMHPTDFWSEPYHNPNNIAFNMTYWKIFPTLILNSSTSLYRNIHLIQHVASQPNISYDLVAELEQIPSSRFLNLVESLSWQQINTRFRCGCALLCPLTFGNIVYNDKLARNLSATAALLGLTYFSLHWSRSVSCRSLHRMVPSLQSPIDTLRSPFTS